MDNRTKRWLARKALLNLEKRTKRREKARNKRRLEYNLLVLNRRIEEKSGEFKNKIRKNFHQFSNKIPLPICTKHIQSKKNYFSTQSISKTDDGHIFIPSNFSLTDNPEESFIVLKRLLTLLYNNSVQDLYLDYKYCETIALDASVCMDILIMEYNAYLGSRKKNNEHFNPVWIRPINFEKPAIQKVLFSIGAFKNVKGYHIDYQDIISYPLCISNRMHVNDPGVDITSLADYILKCLEKMHKTLSPEARNSLCQVIGEILINAEEHASTHSRFSLGFFQDYQENERHTGIVNLVILNFGVTIYEKFVAPDCPNQDTVTRMRELSSHYLKKNFFGNAKFKEETLWTLYALQEGVTSISKQKNRKRGNGSIRFIENFFNLKGAGTNMDNISKLTILSGNTKIVFDGRYAIKNKLKSGHNYKIMAFNESGNIEDQPDSKYVSFVDNYFPGTLISAKILINDDDLEASSPKLLKL